MASRPRGVMAEILAVAALCIFAAMVVTVVAFSDWDRATSTVVVAVGALALLAVLRR